MKRELSNFLRPLLIAVVLLLTAPLVTDAQSDRSDFSGTWALNTMKSSPSAANSSDKLIIKQDANYLTATFTDKEGKTVVSKYFLDGKESINRSGGHESKSTAKFSSDGKKLTIFSKLMVDGTEKTDQDVYSLIDPKTLSVECTVSGSSGDETAKYIYDRR